jgi:uncharacterized protein (TIGR03435 family)
VERLAACSIGERLFDRPRGTQLEVVMRKGLTATALALLTVTVAGQSPTGGPVFDVVSIKRNTTTGPGGFPGGGPPIELPNGDIRLTAVPAVVLLIRAYPTTAGSDIVGLPEWARREPYDVNATSSLSSAAPDDRAAMMRAMLADRFKLAAHVEKREQSVLALVLARKDAKLGTGLTKIDTDCVAKRAADRAAAEAATAAGNPPPPFRPTGLDAVPPPCTLVSVADRTGVTRVRGEGTMADFAMLLRQPMRAQVIDRTGLSGNYGFEMTYQMASLAVGPVDSPGTGPDVATALNELGLKLESTKIERDTLIVDHLERPSEN